MMPHRKNITIQRVQDQDGVVETFEFFHSETGSGYDNNSAPHGHHENDVTERSDNDEVPSMETCMADGMASNDGPESLNEASNNRVSCNNRNNTVINVQYDGVTMPTAGLTDPRNGDGLVLEIDSEFDNPYLSSFNGDYYELYHIVGSVWEKNAREHQITVGITSRHPKKWAKSAMQFLKEKTLRSKACRRLSKGCI